MKLRKVNNKKGLWGMEEMLKIVASVAGIFLLLYLSFSLYGTFVGDKTKTEQGKAILTNLLDKIDTLNSESPNGEFLLESPQGWYLASFEFGKELSADCSSFCICLCKDVECSDTRVCKPTPKFILLRNNEGKERRFLEEKLPVSFKVTLDSQVVYPYSAGTLIDDTWRGTKSVTPLFYNFTDKWMWTPDLINWMPTSTFKVDGGVWNGQEPAKANQEFLLNLNHVATDKEAGETFFNTLRLKKSEGVIIMQVMGENK